MIQQVTRGIKISVETDFEGSFLKDNVLHYAFTYRIEIENQGKSSVQLLTRHWKIKEALNKTQYVNGNGVVGKKTNHQSWRNSQIQIRMFTILSPRSHERSLHYD